MNIFELSIRTTSSKQCSQKVCKRVVHGAIKHLKQFARDKGQAWISSVSQFKALFV